MPPLFVHDVFITITITITTTTITTTTTTITTITTTVWGVGTRSSNYERSAVGWLP